MSRVVLRRGAPVTPSGPLTALTAHPPLTRAVEEAREGRTPALELAAPPAGRPGPAPPPRGGGAGGGASPRPGPRAPGGGPPLPRPPPPRPPAARRRPDRSRRDRDRPRGRGPRDRGGVVARSGLGRALPVLGDAP